MRRIEKKILNASEMGENDIWYRNIFNALNPKEIIYLKELGYNVSYDELSCGHHINWKNVIAKPIKPTKTLSNQKKIVYIAHPISGDIKGNLEKIRLIIRNINLTEPNIVPFAHYWVDCHALDDNNTEERNKGIANDFEFISRGFIDELWLYGDKVSSGMKAEIEICNKYNIPVVDHLNMK